MCSRSAGHTMLILAVPNNLPFVSLTSTAHPQTIEWPQPPALPPPPTDLHGVRASRQEGRLSCVAEVQEAAAEGELLQPRIHGVKPAQPRWLVRLQTARPDQAKRAQAYNQVSSRSHVYGAQSGASAARAEGRCHLGLDVEISSRPKASAA